MIGWLGRYSTVFEIIYLFRGNFPNKNLSIILYVIKSQKLLRVQYYDTITAFVTKICGIGSAVKWLII